MPYREMLQIAADMQESRPRLLIVDDQPANIQTLYQTFADRYEVFMATNAHKGLELCVTKEPDLVLLDVVMPGMDGYEMCVRMKATPQLAGIPVIFVTASDDEEAETRAFMTGAVDFITKPINPIVVRARVNTHLTLKRQADLLRRLALTDGMTGIGNRRAFDLQIDSECRRADRSSTPLGLLMIDVDHFKLYNDHHGHHEGDDCLRAIARVLSGAVHRPGDQVCRYGGEEFACILPETDEQGIAHVANRVLEEIRALRRAHGASPICAHVTVSIGGTVRQPGSGLRPADLIVNADSALYQAKSGGRDRVQISAGTVATAAQVQRKGDPDNVDGVNVTGRDGGGEREAVDARADGVDQA